MSTSVPCTSSPFFYGHWTCHARYLVVLGVIDNVRHVASKLPIGLSDVRLNAPLNTTLGACDFIITSLHFTASTMKCSIAVLAAATCLSSVQQVSGFTSSSIRRDASPLSSSRIRAELEGVKQASTGSDADTFNTDSQLQSRRSILHQCLATGATLSASQLFPSSASAALGTLPEFADVNAVLQSLTIDVTDKQQYDDTIAFFTSAFDGMKVMRQRNNSGGGIKDAVSHSSFFIASNPKQLLGGS